MNSRVPTLLGLLTAGLLLGPAGGSAHEFWLDASDLRPAAGAEIAIHVRGGHYFPASALAVADRLIHRFSVTTAAGTRDLASAAEKRERNARLTLSEPGLHRLDLVIQRPQLEKPEAWARLLVVAGDAASDPADYASGDGLEILPLAPIEQARVGNPVPLKVQNDGTPLQARIQVVPSAGGVAWLDAAPEKAAEFTPRSPGRHLAILTHNGQTSTLVFDVQP